ncbi:MAG: bifunctional DNA-formamidopyrimidine glycosylase/DNA-(apurinic or apyrimidinic site) lyase [Candidatus Levybacteria bacterium]|nr:bifunctional DNA-formamidopyrimidine glycosylase/DNA-(apurinic or apyrimidinic site) lyase [Candidatus Levybacteria bacterium]
MPELPEVETIRIGLQKHLVGHTIQNIQINMAKQINGDVDAIHGAVILEVKRFGKGLVIDLDNGYSITIHVKMTGQMLYKNQKTTEQVIAGNASHFAKATRDKKVDIASLPDKYTHVIFKLDKDAFLLYRDVRQFGWIKIVRSDSVASQPFFKSLGPEPAVAKAMDGRAVLTLKKFQEIVSKRKTPIKMLLMDQGQIAGIGNIYANDALFVAKIHPTRPASSLDLNEQTKLFHAIEEVLTKGIEVGGASEWSYVDALGQAGKYQDFFQVYRKHGQPCPSCGTTIETIRMGGRGTFFCPGCQR